MVRNPTTHPDGVEANSLVYSSVTIVNCDSFLRSNDAHIDVYESIDAVRTMRSFGGD